MTQHYTYRTTTEKLAEAIDAILANGDSVRSEHHTGGRDWVLVCRKGNPSADRAVVLTGDPAGLSATLDRAAEAAGALQVALDGLLTPEFDADGAAR